MANNRILRFHAPDKVFHSLNAITWFALLFTGAYVYFCEPSAEAAEANMIAHLILGAIFTFNLLGFIVVAPDRFALILRACLEWDRNTIYWFRNFGGYPRPGRPPPFGAPPPAASSRSRSVRWKFPRRVATTAVRRRPTCSSWA